MSYNISVFNVVYGNHATFSCLQRIFILFPTINICHTKKVAYCTAVKCLKNYDHCILLNFTLRSTAHYLPNSLGIVLVSLNPSRKYKSNSSLSVNPFKNISTLTVSSSLQKKKRKRKKKRKHKKKQKKKKTN